MSKLRTIAVTVAATTLSLSLVGVSAPAHADSSWGCGGYCRHMGTTK